MAGFRCSLTCYCVILLAGMNNKFVRNKALIVAISIESVIRRRMIVKGLRPIWLMKGVCMAITWKNKNKDDEDDEDNN